MNEQFLKDMSDLLGDDYPAFLASLSVPMRKALRINTLKASREMLAPLGSQGWQAVPFAPDTYYVPTDNQLGVHPWHQAGLYYLQEPSTTAAVTALSVQPGDRVLDLCAAPGGKSTQIMTALAGTGLLWSNEIDRSRCQTLLGNLERWGDDGYILTGETPERLAAALGSSFDRILVDAPCSGEGMYKKYDVIDSQYSQANAWACQRRQLSILDQAVAMLRPGGTMVYSTCTYNRHENEQAMALFLKAHPDMMLVPTGLKHCRPGFPQDGMDAGLVSRILPMDGGEGHFVARLVRRGDQPARMLKTGAAGHEPVVDRFLQEAGITVPYQLVEGQVWGSRQPPIRTAVHVIRQGVMLGEVVKGRFEPHHHLFVALLGQTYKNVCDIGDADVLRRYLAGEALPLAGYHGYVQIRWQGVPVGFGKADGSQIKNHYPKGLRRR